MERKEKQELLYGFHAIMEAIESGKEVEKLLIKKGLKGDLFQAFFMQVRQLNIPFQYVPIEKLNKLTPQNHQGVIAYISPIEFHDPEKVITEAQEAGRTPLVLILDKVTDVRNFGAIARSAECAGVDAIIIPDKGSARINADAIKTSAGALHNIKVCRVKNLVDVVMLFQQMEIQIISATEKAEKYHIQADLTKPTAIIMGAEDKGIEQRLLRMSDELVKIPINGKIQSLNVSVAASLMVYEAVRQRM
ncbi:23S rRNA (guanosine(2251)-2'-O)-methyltransferase RlmB [Prolixibacteraceae bacterium JC049]|nr:23S rRNA (guanosine(2251)-2'-O)-methyltransferase RlmB [Prolixibacteraceae bacterium JC049]